MLWIEKGDVINARLQGNTINVCYRTIGVTCYLAYIEIDSDVARENKMYYERYGSPRDSEFYGAVGEYLKTH